MVVTVPRFLHWFVAQVSAQSLPVQLIRHCLGFPSSSVQRHSSRSAECNLPLRMSHFTFKRPKTPFPTVPKLTFNSNPEQGLCFTAAWTWPMRPGVWRAPRSDSIKQRVIKAQQRATLPLRNSIPATIPALVLPLRLPDTSENLKFTPQCFGRDCSHKTFCSGL